MLIPQIIHNQKSRHIGGLSLWLHFLLYVSYSFDMVYGIADQMPLQYRMVSVVGLCLVMMQHIQLLKFHVLRRSYLLVKLGFLFLVTHAVLYYVFFSKLNTTGFSANSILLLGIVARGCEIIYCVPQIFKNRISRSASAVSRHFIYLSLFVAVLETLSAWCLDWEWPNKVVAPLSMLVMFIILLQHYKYSSKRKLQVVLPAETKISLARAA